MKYKLPVNGQWLEFSDATLSKLRAGGKEAQADALEERLADYKMNPLKYFLPHGVAWHEKEISYANGRIILQPSTYPKDYGNDGVAFLNDWENDFSMLVAPRKVGKSITGAAFILLHGAIKTDPSWPVYTEHHVEYREWNGPTQVIVASFAPQNLGEVWKAYREIMPRDELGQYADDYGAMPGEKPNRKRRLNFGDGQPKEFTAAKSGTRFIFMTYSQRQASWENFLAQMLHADEQIPMDKLTAFLDGTRTMGDYTPVIFTLSGFVLPERPDTGAAGPIKRGIYDGRNTRGRTVGRFHMDIPSTPKAIVTESKKKQAYDQYVNPKIDRSRKDERRGLATYFPGWEPGGGLLFDADVWQPRVHIIPDLWEKKVGPPKDWTLWRSVDYADRGVTCCSWWAVGPQFAVLYRLLYERNLLIADTVQRIIEMSGNERAELPPRDDQVTGNTYKVYKEVSKRETFYRDILDSRAAKWRQQGESVIDMFQRYGMSNMDTASSEHNETQIPALKDWLRIDWGVNHPFLKEEDGSPYKGCPKVFVFESCSTPVIDELEGLPENEEGTRVLSKGHIHDFIDSAKYWASDGPQYLGDYWGKEDNDEYGPTQPRRTPETGY